MGNARPPGDAAHQKTCLETSLSSPPWQSCRCAPTPATRRTPHTNLPSATSALRHCQVNHNCRTQWTSSTPPETNREVGMQGNEPKQVPQTCYLQRGRDQRARTRRPCCPVLGTPPCNTERIAIRTVSQVGAGSEHKARAVLPLAMAAKQNKRKQKKML